MSLIYTTPITTSNKQRFHIYLGGKEDAKDRSRLERLGITHILNVTPEKEVGIQSGVPNYFESSNKFKYKRIPIYDIATTNILSYAPVIVSFITTALYHGNILVHCQKGVSRSPTAIMLYLMKQCGMTFDDAFKLCKQRGKSEVAPIPPFIDQLKQYEKECIENGSIAPRKNDDKDSITGREQHINETNKKNELKRKISSGTNQVIGPQRPNSNINSNKNDVPVPSKKVKGCMIGPARPSHLPPDTNTTKETDK